MPISRRRFLSGLTACSGVNAVSSLAFADTKLGAATLTTVSDGHLVLPGGFAFDTMPQTELMEVLKPFGLSTAEVTPDCNIALYRDGTHTVLFDVGSGPDFMPTAGRLTATLEAIDLAPEDITHVIFTHAHPDHIWGLLDEFDDPVFANAQYMMGRDEWDYWWNPETVQTIGDARASFAVGAKRRMEVIEDAVSLFDDGQEILPGIAALATYGHTPGHMSFELRHGSDAAMVTGDAIANHHVAFVKPDWPSGADQDPDQAIIARRMLLDRLSTENMMLAGFHLPGGGIGRVEASGDGYRFIEGDV